MQMGTAIADHPAFRGFPCNDFLEPVFMRLVDKAVRMGPAFKGIEPLMVGMGRHQGGKGRQGKLPDFLVYAFEARVGMAACWRPEWICSPKTPKPLVC